MAVSCCRTARRGAAYHSWGTVSCAGNGDPGLTASMGAQGDDVGQAALEPLVTENPSASRDEDALARLAPASAIA